MFKVGDKVLIPDSLHSASQILEKVITKVEKDTIQCGSVEQTYYKAFCWPASAREELIKILETRAELKKAFDDSMKLVYELKNKISRGEL